MKSLSLVTKRRIRPSWRLGCGIGAPGWPVSEYRRLCRDAGTPGRGDRRRRAAHVGFALAARTLGVRLQVVEVRGPDDFDRAFSEMIGARTDALIVLTSAT